MNDREESDSNGSIFHHIKGSSYILLDLPGSYRNAFKLATPEEVTSADAITYITERKNEKKQQRMRQLPNQCDHHFLWENAELVCFSESCVFFFFLVSRPCDVSSQRSLDGCFDPIHAGRDVFSVFGFYRLLLSYIHLVRDKITNRPI